MQPLSYPRFKAFKDDGSFGVGYKLHSYAAGTSSPQATYSNQGLSSANTNPVIMDGSGEAEIWLDPALSYKLVLTDDADVTVWSVDNVNVTTEGTVSLGGPFFYAHLSGPNPIINFDANDYLFYDVGTNNTILSIAGVTAVVISSTGLGSFNNGLDANNAGIAHVGPLSGVTTATIGTSLTVGGGTAVKQIRTFQLSVPVDPGSIATVSRGSIEVTIGGSLGIAVGDFIGVISGVSLINDDLIFEGAEVTGADKITFYFYNPTGAPIDDASHNFSILWIDLT